MRLDHLQEGSEKGPGHTVAVPLALLHSFPQKGGPCARHVCGFDHHMGPAVPASLDTHLSGNIHISAKVL